MSEERTGLRRPMATDQESVALSGRSADLSDTADEPLLGMVGQIVVLDTQGPLLYIGTLECVRPTFLTLTDADVHDSNDARATKDLYLVETRALGVRSNRARVVVTRGQVASVSRLEDVHL